MKKMPIKIIHFFMLMNLFFSSLIPATVVAIEQVEGITNSTSVVSSGNETTEKTEKQDRNASAFGKNALKLSTSTSAEDWPLSMRIGEIALDAQGLTESLEGSYIDIKYEGQFIETFTVGQASFIEKVEYLTEGDNRIARVHLGTIDSTTSLSFSYTMNFKKGLTPKGYTVSGSATWKQADGTILKEAEGEAVFRVKTLDIDILKLPGREFYSYDNYPYYGGSTNANGYIEEPEYVLFTFRSNFNHEGTYYDRTRLMEKIVLTDTLPTYTDEQGATRTAQFDTSKNPGWVDNGNGTVSYTLTASDQSENLVEQIRKVDLYLKFPGAKAGYNSSYKNHVKADWHPFNETLQDQKSAEDDVSIRLRPDVFPGGFAVKRGEWTLKIREGSNHDLSIGNVGSYLIEMKNSTPYSVNELTIEDTELDSQLLFHSIVPLRDGSNKFQLIAIDGDGKETEVKDREVIDKVAIQQNKDTAAKVESGELAKADAPETPQTIKKLKIKLKDGEQLLPNDEAVFRVQVVPGVLYNNASLLNKFFENKATFIGKLTTEAGKEFPFNTEQIGRIRAQELVIKADIAKDTRNNPTGAVDEVVSYNIEANFTQLPSVVDFENPRIIDLLPEGIRFEKLESSNLTFEVEVIENFNDSNRQAVIFKFKEKIQPTKIAYPGLRFSARITEEATPSSVDTFKKNENRVYFVTGKETIDGTTLVQLKAEGEVDEFDVNQNGDKTDRLIGARSNTIVAVPTQIRSEKLIKRATDTTWSKNRQLMDYDEQFMYRLRTVNNTNETFRHFVLYDKLPVKGGKQGFANIMTGPVVAPSGFKVYYNTATDLPDHPAEAVRLEDWNEAVSDYSKVTGIKIEMVAPEVIEPGEDINFDIPMKAPSYEDSGELDGKVSSNAYYVNRDANDLTNFGVSNSVENQLPQYFFVTKEWKNRDYELRNLTMELYRESEPDKVVATVELNEENGWKGILKRTNQNTIIDPNITDWKVREKLPENYEGDYEGTQEKTTSGFYVMNKRVTTSHTVEKIWSDQDDKLGLRSSIAVQLKQDGVPYGNTVVLNAENQWTYTFTELPKLNNGKVYKYTVDEVSVPTGYYNEIKNEDGKTVITNHLITPVKVDLTVNKILEGRSILDGEFQFNLLDDQGKVLGKATATAEGLITFKDVTFEKAGIYQYKIVEVAGKDETIQYDSSQKEVVITVVQDGNTYQASVTYPRNTVFRNTYTPPTTTTEVPPTTTKEIPKQPELPNTGENDSVVVMIMAIVSAVAGVVVLNKKQRRNV